MTVIFTQTSAGLPAQWCCFWWVWRDLQVEGQGQLVTPRHLAVSAQLQPATQYTTMLYMCRYSRL